MYNVNLHIRINLHPLLVIYVIVHVHYKSILKANL